MHSKNNQVIIDKSISRNQLYQIFQISLHQHGSHTHNIYYMRFKYFICYDAAINIVVEMWTALPSQQMYLKSELGLIHSIKGL